MSEPSLLEAYRKQCRFTKEPWTVLLVWKMSSEVTRGEVELDDLIDISREVAEELAS